MSALHDFKQAKANLRSLCQWADMIGKRYEGGGGGVGAIRSAGFTATIYYQQHDGSKNYHESAGMGIQAVNSALNHAAAELGPKIIERALFLLQEAVTLAAQQAEGEAREVIALVGDISEGVES